MGNLSRKREREGDCRKHLSARWDPPGTINEGLEDLDWTSWTRDLHTPDHRYAGAADIQCAARAKPPPCLNWKLKPRAETLLLESCIKSSIEY